MIAESYVLPDRLDTRAIRFAGGPNGGLPKLAKSQETLVLIYKILPVLQISMCSCSFFTPSTPVQSRFCDASVELKSAVGSFCWRHSLRALLYPACFPYSPDSHVDLHKTSNMPRYLEADP